MRKKASLIFDDVMDYLIRPCLFYIMVVALFTFVDIHVATILAEGIFVSLFLLVGLSMSMIFRDLREEKVKDDG